MSLSVRVIRFICLLSFLLIMPIKACSMTLPWSEILLRHEEYVLTLQSQNGYITMTPFGANINPYFANLALWGLVDNLEYDLVIKKWAIWYINHLNKPDNLGISGTIYDYKITGPNQLTPTKDYDSSDSYAATFLTLMRRYYDTTHDEEFLLGIEPEICLISEAIYATRDPEDGLTFAKKNYKIKYLMDNLEVWVGLKDWAYLLDNLYNKPEQAEKVYKDADLIKQSLQKMWQGKYFSFAKDEKSVLFITDTSTFYPDMTAQLMAIAFDLATEEQTSIIWSDFSSRFPKWTQLGHLDSFPWSLMAYTAAKVGDWDNAVKYLNSVELTYGSMNYPYPWYCAESSWYLLTLRRLTKGSE